MVFKLYPLMFDPYYKEFIWGDRNLEKYFNKQLPPNKQIGESWEIFDENIISNGSLAGKSLNNVLSEYGEKLIGTRLTSYKYFPIILKLSSTNLDLSVQVHPDDVQAKQLEPQSLFSGKFEMIYILKAEKGARVYYGLKGKADRQEIKNYLTKKDSVIEILNEISVHPGDIIYVPPGTIHAYGKGLVYLEIQQYSDITYRMFDWNRLDKTGNPRELHIEKALKVINLDAVNPSKISRIHLDQVYGDHIYLLACEKFLVEEIILNKEFTFTNSGETFHIITVLEGALMIKAPSLEFEDIQLGKGDVVLMPASLENYILSPLPKSKIIRCSIPDVKQIVDNLLSSGVEKDQIVQLGGDINSKNDLIEYFK